MKILLALSVITSLAALFGGVFYNQSGKPVTPVNPKVAETVLVKSSSPNSVVNTTTSLTSLSKTVSKPNVNLARVLYLDDEVTFPVVNELVNKIKELNTKSSEPIYLLIDSPGGSVLDGATLISEMEASKAPVNTVCTRLCASMAAAIHSYGSKRYGTDRAILMYHPASSGAKGQIPNMLSQLSTITRYIEKMVAYQVGRSKMTPEDFNKRVSYEFWVDTEDATNLGLNDGLVNLNVPSYQPSLITFQPAPEEKKKDNQEPVHPTDVQWISPHLEYWNRK